MKVSVEITEELPENWMVIDNVIAYKCLDQNGQSALAIRASGLTTWEALGMLIAAADACRDSLRTMFGTSEED